MILQRANFKTALKNCSQWVDSKSLPGYQVHPRGVIRNAETGLNLRPGKSKNGYLTVRIKKTLTVHRIIAEAFIENPQGKKCVNHRDGQKRNNNISNLEWNTHSENNSHAIQTGLKKKIVEPKGIIQMDIDGNEVARYRTSEEAIGFRSGCICLCCNGKRKTHKGYKWSFIN